MCKRRSLALTLVILGLMLFVAPLSTLADTQYSNNLTSFSLPDDWTGPNNGDPTASGGVTYVNADSSISMNVTAVPVPDGSTLNDVVQAAVAQFATSDGYVPDPNGVQSDSLGGEPAFVYAFTSNNSAGLNVATITYFVAHSGMIYAVTFATTPDNIPTATPIAQGIVNSWQFM